MSLSEAGWGGARRPRGGGLPFAAVNRPGRSSYSPDLQRHHLLPRQATALPALQHLFDSLGRDRIGFHDFRRNGLLLPARDSAVLRLALPLHLGRTATTTRW